MLKPIAARLAPKMMHNTIAILQCKGANTSRIYNNAKLIRRIEALR